MTMQAHEQVDFIKAVGAFCIEQIDRATDPLKKRIEQLEKFISDLPVPVNGVDGKDGKDADPSLLLEMKSMIENNNTLILDLSKSVPVTIQDWTRDYVQGALSALPVPKDGKDGIDGANGVDGARGIDGAPGKDGTSVTLEEVKPLVCEAIDNIVAGWERPRDGKDGRDGVDGADGKSIQLDDLRGLLADLVAKAVGELPVPRHVTGGFIDRFGNLSLAFSDGTFVDLGPVVGKDGKDCDMEIVAEMVRVLVDEIEKPKDGAPGKDGIDGLGIENIEYDGKRTLTMSNSKVSKTFVLPIPLYEELWKDNTLYQRGDWVTRDGSIFVCITGETNKMPGTADSGWRLAIKRGRDGKDGKVGERGPEGKAGRDGRDLTQVGPDGSKWG